MADGPACSRVLMYSTAAQAALGLATIPFYRGAGLSVAWGTVLPHIVLLLALAALFFYFVALPGSPRERVLPDTMAVAFLLILVTNVASPAQYLAVTLKRPLVDAHLAAADAWLGIHVPALAAWTSAHGPIAAALRASYFTLLPQFVLPILILGMWSADRERLWEYCFHFHVCLLATIACLALWPAECAFAHYGFPSTIDQSRFIQHFTSLRQGTFHVIRFDDLEGLISMPSFHVAGALMVTWAFRGYRWVLYPLVVVNVCLVLATFMSGAHYFVDVLATVGLFGVSLAAYRYCCSPGKRAGSRSAHGYSARTVPLPITRHALPQHVCNSRIRPHFRAIPVGGAIARSIEQGPVSIDRHLPLRRTITLAMLLNATMIAGALAANAWSTVREPVAGEREWRSPRTPPLDLDPLRDEDPFFTRLV